VNQTQATETKLIELAKLARSPLNVRRTERKNGLDELKASILAHGLMQNLVVTAKGNHSHQVIAGGRRLEALRALREEGAFPRATPSRARSSLTGTRRS
jgi:ParB family chromosome partitioning protein